VHGVSNLAFASRNTLVNSGGTEAETACGVGPLVRELS
jgi:hypothetical protein